MAEESKRRSLQRMGYIGSFALLAMAAFAIYFAKERLYADAGYFLVRVIDEETFHVINQRWLMPLIQWLPMLGVKLGLPLTTITALYSLGNVALAMALFGYVGHVLRDRQHALILVATQFVGLAQALFCPVFELYYGAMLLIALRALLQSERIHTRSGRIIACLLFALVATCHFLGLLVLLLMLSMDRIWQQRKLAIAFGIILAVLMAQRFIGLSGYEDRALSTVLLRAKLDGLAWIFAPGRLWPHAAQALGHYPDAIIVAIFTVFVAWRRKAWWTLGVLLAGHLIIYTLVSLYFPDGTHDRYRETLDYAHVLWALLSAAWAVQHVQRSAMWSTYIFTVLFIPRVLWSIHVGHTFTERMEWMEERITHAREQGITKGLDTAARPFIAPGFNNAPLYTPAPFEYLLLSAMDSPDRTVVLVSIPRVAYNANDLHTIEQALRSEGVMLPERSNGSYFHMPQGPFKLME